MKFDRLSVKVPIRYRLLRDARYALVWGLERACALMRPVTHRRPWLWLPVRVCQPALWSYELGEHWGTGYWSAPDGDDDEEEME